MGFSSGASDVLLKACMAGLDCQPQRAGEAAVGPLEAVFGSGGLSQVQPVLGEADEVAGLAVQGKCGPEAIAGVAGPSCQEMDQT